MPGHNKQPPKKKKNLFKGVEFTTGKGVKKVTDPKEHKKIIDEMSRRRYMNMFNKLPKKLQEEIKTKLLGVEARRGKTVAKKTTAKKSGAKPSNPALYARVKAEAKRKFKVYPSAYANAWLVRTYKKRGGRYS